MNQEHFCLPSPLTAFCLCHLFYSKGGKKELKSVLFPAPAVACLSFSLQASTYLPQFLLYSKDFKWALPSIPLAESRSQGWSDADHMESLCMMVLTLHSVCLLSQDFPWRSKIGLATFFSPHSEFQHAERIYGFVLGCESQFISEDNDGETEKVHTNQLHVWAQVINRQLRFNVTVVIPKHTLPMMSVSCLCKWWCHLKEKGSEHAGEHRQKKTV